MSDAAIERLSRKREQRGGNRAAVEELQAEVEALREQLQFAEDQSKQLLEERDDAQDGLLEAQNNVQQAAEFGQQLLEQVQSLQGDLDLTTEDLDAVREESEELRQTNAVLQQDKVKLNDALESIIEESGLEAEQLEQLKSKQRAASTDQETAKDELVRLRKTADEAERHVNTLTAQLETAQEERDDFKKKLDGLDASAMQSKLEDLYGELADTTERSAAQVEGLEGQNQELQEAYDELERKSKGLRSTLMSRFSEAQAKAKEEESVLRDQLDELQMEITELRSGDNGGGLGGSDSLASELNPAPRPSPGKSKELEDKLRAQDEDIASLGDSNRKLQDELVAATSKTQEAELGLAAVTEKVSAAEEALTKSQTSLDEERAKSKALQSELLAAKELSIGNADALDSKLVAKDDEVKQAQRQLAESEAALAKATTTMTKKVEALEEAKADAKAQLEESKVALSAMKAENQASIRDLTKSSREAEASLQVAKNSLEIAQKTLSDTEQLLQEAHVKASSMEAAADKLRLEVRTLTESEEKFQSQAMSQSSSQSEKAAQIATLKDENARLDALRKKADVQLEEHLDAHAKRLGSWNDKEAELHVSLKAKSDEILELKTKLQEAEGSKDVAEAGAAEVMKLKDALAKEKDEAHRLHEQLQQEKDRSAEHLTALREMRDEKDGAISEKEQIQLIVNSLEHETGRLKAQLSQMAEGSGKTEEDAVAKQREMDEELAALFEEMERNEQVAKETERALGNEICDREEELVEVKAELEDLQSERDRFTAHHQEIQDAMEGIAKEDAVLQEELNAVKRDNLILGADVSSTREALESKAAEVLRLEKVCDASDAQIAKINQQLSGAETAKGDAERKAASMTQRFDALLAEFRVLETTASESKEKHAAEVVELNAIVSGLKADKDRKHAELLSGTRSLSEIRLRAEQLEHQVDTLKIEIEDAQIKAEEMEDEHEDELAQLNEELEMSKAEAEAVAETCQEEIDEIADREEKLQFEKQMLEDRQAQLEAKLANLAAITSQERTASLTRTQALETTADELTTQKENLLRELKAASANVVRLEDFLKSTTAAYEKFKAGVSDREAKLADQLNFKAEELEEVTAEKDSLLDEVNDLMVLTSELHDDVTAEKERREQHQLEVEQQQLEYDRQIDALKFEKEEAAEQIQEHGGSKKELARLAHSLEKLQKEHAALVEENHTVEEENMSMQEEINDLLSITQELRDENDELKELGALSPDGASGEVQGLAGLTGITSESLAEQRSDELEAEVKALKTELNQQKVRMREKELAVKRANLKWKEEVEQSKSEYDAASSDLIKELEEYRDEINELLQVNTDLRNDIEVLKEGCGAGAGTDSGGSGGGQNDSLLGNSAENALAKMNLDDLCSQLEKFRQAVLEKDVRVKELEIETSGLSRKNGELDHKLAASIEEQNTLMGFMTEVNEELKELKQNRGGNLDALAAQTTLLGSSAVLEGMSGVQTAFINSELEVALEDAKAKDVAIEALGMAQKELQHDVDELQKDVKAKLIQVQQVEAELDELTSENDELLELVRTTNEENKEMKNQMATGTFSGPLSPGKTLFDAKLLEKQKVDLGRAEQREVVLVRPKKGEKSWGMMIGPLPGNRQGARISELVPGGLAQKAGALIDDVIVSVNGKTVLDMPVGGVAGEVKRSGDTLRFMVAAASQNADFLDLQKENRKLLVENKDLEMAIRDINAQLEKSKDYTAKSTIDQKMQLKREQEAHRKTKMLLIQAKGGSSKPATSALSAETKANDFFAQARLQLQKIQTQGKEGGADEKTSSPSNGAVKEKGRFGRKSKSPKK